MKSVGGWQVQKVVMGKAEFLDVFFFQLTTCAVKTRKCQATQTHIMLFSTFKTNVDVTLL